MPFVEYKHQKLTDLDLLGSLDGELAMGLAKDAAAKSQTNALQVADAALVVFAHSILDEFVWKVASLCIRIDPYAWKAHVLEWAHKKSRIQYSLASLEQCDFLKELTAVSEKYAASLKRLSIHDLAEHIVKVINRVKLDDDIYKLQIAGVRECVALRNELIHGDTIDYKLQPEEVEKCLNAAALMATFLFSIVAVRYGVGVLVLERALTAISLS
jgi:hypothetical protein